MGLYEHGAPTEDDVATARRLLDALDKGARNLTLTVDDQPVEIPTPIILALMQVARLVSEGHAVDVLPTDVEVSAQDAADILKVSRPYLLNLVKKGILAYRMVGAHHRIPMSAVIAYKREQEPRRRSLEMLSAETQDLGH